MPNFRFTITRDTTESASVVVKADNIESAQELAQSREYENKVGHLFQADEGSVSDVYLPDDDDWEETHDEPTI